MATINSIAWRQPQIAEGWEDVIAYVPVWISVAAFDEAWRKCEGHIGVGGYNSLHPGKYEKFGVFFAGASWVRMPTVCLDDNKSIAFTDGRHRLAWLRDQGLAALPIETPPEQQEAILSAFGTHIRIRTI